MAAPVAGAGLEWLVSPNVALRAEGLYYWFDQDDTPAGQTGVGGIKDTWAVRVGASLYLGRDGDGSLFSQAPMGEAFSGFYIGAHAGYGSAEYAGVYSGGRATSAQSLDNAGYLVGGHAGYNWKSPQNFVAGVEADISVAPWDAAKALEPDSLDYLGAHLSGIASLRGRLGYAFDRTLLYATGGVAFASSTGSFDSSMEFNNHKSAEIVVGPVAGAGIEWMATPNIALRAEGLYYWFDQKQSNNTSPSDYGGIQNTWVARLGASYYIDPSSDGGGGYSGGYGGEMFDADFSGFYAGGHVGYGSADYAGAHPDEPLSYNFDNRGYLVGAHAGYNWQYGDNGIIGVETDLTMAPWSEIEGSSSFGVSGHLSGIASLRGRLGYAFDRSLITATAGVAFASSNATADYSTFYNNAQEIVAAPVAGAGYEWMVSENLSLRAEGLYYWFDQKQTSHHSSGFGGIQNTWVARVGASWHAN